MENRGIYEQVYGLKERAFEPAPDARFHFPALSHRRAMSAIGFGLNRGAGIIAIHGAEGTGKTQLIAHVLDQVERDKAVIAMLTLTGEGESALVEKVAAAFGIEDAGGPDAARKELTEFLASEREAGRAALLLIDEAQHLSAEDARGLAVLAGLTRDQRALLQILVAGEEALARSLDDGGPWQGVRGRVVAEHRLEPMLADEIDPYLYHRLTVAGRSGSPQIDPGLASLLHEATGGVPLAINAVMSTLLDRAAELGEDMISGDALVPLLDEPEEAVREAEPEPTPEPTPATEPATTPEIGQPAPPARSPVRETAIPAPTHVPDTAEPDPQTTDRLAAVDATLAEHDLCLRELRRELAALRVRPTGADSDTGERIAALEQRLDQQEQALRHILGRLIAFFEGQRPEG